MIPHILNGGDITIEVTLKRRYVNNGIVVEEGLLLSALTDVQVVVVNENNTTVPVTHEDAGDNTNRMNIDISVNTSTPSYYGLKIAGKLNGRNVRAYRDRYFKLVYTEEEANITANSNDVYVMTVPMIIR